MAARQAPRPVLAARPQAGARCSVDVRGRPQRKSGVHSLDPPGSPLPSSEPTPKVPAWNDWPGRFLGPRAGSERPSLPPQIPPQAATLSSGTPQRRKRQLVPGSQRPHPRDPVGVSFLWMGSRTPASGDSWMGAQSVGVGGRPPPEGHPLGWAPGRQPQTHGRGSGGPGPSNTVLCLSLLIDLGDPASILQMGGFMVQRGGAMCPRSHS